MRGRSVAENMNHLEEKQNELKLMFDRIRCSIQLTPVPL